MNIRVSTKEIKNVAVSNRIAHIGGTLERGKFQKSSSRIYGAHTMVFQAQISNFIEFGPEMAQRNGAEVCSIRVINENQSCPGKVMA